MKASLKVSQGDFLDGLSLYMEALNIFESLDDNTGIVRVYNRIAAVFFYLERYEEGVTYGKRAEKLFEKTNNEHLLYLTYDEIAMNLLSTAQFDEALEYVDKAMSIALKLRVSPSAMASLHNSRGNTLKNMGRYDEAIKSYMLCSEITYELNQPSRKSVSSANIADAYTRKGDFKSALPYQLESYEIME